LARKQEPQQSAEPVHLAYVGDGRSWLPGYPPRDVTVARENVADLLDSGLYDFPPEPAPEPASTPEE
jgi:hypothetical protein